jgi:low temperature requirement protein LtrA
MTYLPGAVYGYVWIFLGIIMLAIGLDSVQSDFTLGVAMLIGCAVAFFIGLMFFKSFRKKMLKALGRAP